MTDEIVIVFGVLAGALVLLVTDLLRPDVVALLVLLALVATGVLAPSQAFAGFGTETIMFLAGLFVMSGGLVRAGAVEALARWLRARLKNHPNQLAPACVTTVAAVSAFLSNTVTVSLFVPVVNVLSRRGGVRPGSVLMPIAFASMLGGVCTVVGTSTNVVVSGQLLQMGEEPYGLFTTAAIGLPALVIGLAYLLWIAPRLLERPASASVEEEYEMRRFLAEVVVGDESSWVGHSVRTLRPRDAGIDVLGVVRPPRVEMRMLSPGEPIKAGDRLVVKGSPEDILTLTRQTGLRTIADEGPERSGGRNLVLVEAMVAPGSTLVGHTLKEAHFRQRFGGAAVAIYRHGGALHQKLGRVRLHVGDILLVQGPRQSADALAEDNDVIVLDDWSHHRPRTAALVTALAIFGGFLVTALLTGHVAVAALAGATAMVLAGCLTPEDAYDVLDWRLLVLVGGMVSLATAMSTTGAAAWLAHGLVGAVGDWGPRALVAGFFLLTVILTQTMSNQAAALVVLPVALAASAETGMPVRPMAMSVTVAASCAFLTPLEPASLLVFGPGRYRFSDFARVGAPLTLIVLVLTVWLVPLIWHE